MTRVVVIGAGVGGLTTASVLARAGMDVTVLEAHIYPGGCAGTFYYQGYRFDAGATLAGGFYPGGPMDLLARAAGIPDWSAQPSDPALVVHLPDGRAFPRWSDERRWSTRRAVFGQAGESFFRWQERTADALWALALQGLPWPPQSLTETLDLLGKGLAWSALDPLTRLNPTLLADAMSPVKTHLEAKDTLFKLFIDAQLLISAQTTSDNANALYGASALDLPRRGVVHLRGGMGSISERLMEAVRKNGGRVHMRQRVAAVHEAGTRAYRVQVERGDDYEADLILFNLPPWNIRSLLKAPLPRPLDRLSPHPERGWGAFMIYLGVDGKAIPPGLALHHQILANNSLTEGNSIFLSISPEWDPLRAPEGRRAITISTHTNLDQWWADEDNPRAYREKRQRLQEKILRHISAVLPGIESHTEIILDGTPRTFAYFTGRDRGWVGGFPQVNLMQNMGPRLSPTMYMVGDSIFPGQSTAAVALGGLRVARSMMRFSKNRPAKRW